MNDVWTRLRIQLNVWKDDTIGLFPKVVVALVVVVLAFTAARLMRAYLRKLRMVTSAAPGSVARILPWLLYVVVILTGSFLALEIVGLEGVLTKLLASAGVMGVVAGFALKDITANAFSGFLVRTQQPFHAGDWVSFGDTYGCVEKINWIVTSVRTVTGQIVFVPNQLIYGQPFTNFSRSGRRRVVIQTGVSYGDDLAHVKRVALDEIREITGPEEKDSIDFFFTSIGAYCYNFEVRFWIRFERQVDFLSAQSEAIMRIKSRFEKENISIAYPVQTLDFDVKGGVNVFDRPIKVDKVAS